MQRWLLFLIISGLLTISDLAASAATPRPPREIATYQVRWTFLVVGQVEIAAEEEAAQSDPAVRHFSLTSRTLPFFDAIYKVRDRIDSYTDPALDHSLLYKKTQRGKRVRDIEVVFDWRRDQALYRLGREQPRPISLKPGTFDPLGAYFFYRRQELRVGGVVARPVSDGEKLVLGQARILGRQRITVPAGTFDTFLVEPNMQEVQGVFEKSSNARLLVWLTSDSRHLLVKAESKVALGSIVAELTSSTGAPGP